MKEGLPRPAAPPQAYVDKLFRIYKKHAMAGAESVDMSQSNPEFRHFVEAQATWDRAMAEALAQRVRSGLGGQRLLAVGIMGAGHVRNGNGVPHQLHNLGISKFTKLLPVSARRGCKPFDASYADAVFALPKHPVNEVRLGAQLDIMEGDIHIVGVEQDSVAEQAGLGVVVESQQPGWGASGRSAGRVLPTLKSLDVFKQFAAPSRAELSLSPFLARFCTYK